MDISIVDYKAGNAVNVKNAFEKLGASASIAQDEKEWEKASAIVFPGVGSFGAAVKNLGGRVDSLRELIAEGTPFLGICLGMQLLMEKSEESGGIPGLGVVPGTAKRLEGTLPVPHMGWNKVEEMDSPLFEGMDAAYAYFVHSYCCIPSDAGWIAAKTEYEKQFASAFWKGNVFATQFHPEKSGAAGLKMLQNFIREVKK